MAARIEDYALIGDMHTAALIANDGSLDWLPLPRFDSMAAFARLIGDGGNGIWRISPQAPVGETTRRYLGDTLVLETTMGTCEGSVRMIDFMPMSNPYRRVVRIVQGVTGNVPMSLAFRPRFDYGEIVPWFSAGERSVLAVSGPIALTLIADVELERRGAAIEANFALAPGERASFVMSASLSHEARPDVVDSATLLAETLAWWTGFAQRSSYRGIYRDAVMRSLLTLKALTYAPTGAIVAAPTTSLPEAIGGVRNWDYRYCWLRDATFTLIALMNAGYFDEAGDFMKWLVRTIAGDPDKVQIMYGVGGERRLAEYELTFLGGYESSPPVRIGNAASDQFQLDVYGEVVDAGYAALKGGMVASDETWAMLRGVIDYVAHHWQNPADNGMWEVRGGRRHFTHSKVMAWVAFDRAVKIIEDFGYPGPLDEYRAMRERVHHEVCAQAYDQRRRTFTQSYGSQPLDASVLLIPLVGFLPADDDRVRGTLAAVERELFFDPFVLRYSTETNLNVDGLPPGEGAFLACSFWLADNYTLAGRYDDARRLFEKLLGLRNDLGLLSEEYDVRRGRLVGNFPQAFSHLALVNTALNLERYSGPAKQRADQSVVTA